jgi:prolyl-tRNA synthetase
VPVRIEVGPRDLAQGMVTLARRDTGTKEQVALDGLAARLPGLLEQIQGEMLTAATTERDARTVDASGLDEAVDATTAGFARLPWAAAQAEGGEARLRESSVTVRVLQRPDGSLPGSEDDPDLVAYVARAY